MYPSESTYQNRCFQMGLLERTYLVLGIAALGLPNIGRKAGLI